MINTDVSDGNKNPYNQEVIDALQSEVDFYKTEHEVLRKDVLAVAGTNKELYDLLHNRAKLNVDGDFTTYKTVTDQAIQNLRKQIYLLDEEKQTLHNLWKASQQTVASLEAEVKEYLKQFKDPSSIFEVKRAYDNAIKALESKISSLQNEMRQAKSSFMNLEESKRLCEQKLTDLDKKHNELLTEHTELLEQLKHSEQIARAKQTDFASIVREKERLEQKIAVFASAQKAYRIREAIAYSKIQEAINVADTALAEKNAALVREKDIREERDQLAVSISEVMEEAGNKVESDVDVIRQKYNEKLQAMRKNLLLANRKVDVQSKRTTDLERSVATLEAEIKKLHNNNQSLDEDLQMASKTIIELEIKLQAYDKLMAKEQEITNTTEDQNSLLKHFYDTNRRLKENWKRLFDDMTDKLQSELEKCQTENTTLKMENLQLKTIVLQLENQKNDPKLS